MTLDPENVQNDEDFEVFTCKTCGKDFKLTYQEIDDGYDTEKCEECQAGALHKMELDEDEFDTEEDVDDEIDKLLDQPSSPDGEDEDED